MKKIFLFSLFSFLFGAPIFVFAAATISAAIPGMTNVTTSTPPGAYVSGFYDFALMIGGVLAFGAIVYGGVLYAISMGNPSRQSEGKEWIQSALIGLLLLAGATLILTTINPNLVNLSLPTLQAINIQAPTSGSGTGGGGGTFNPFNGDSGNNGSGGGGASGYSSTADEIAALASSSRGADTSSGPGGGAVACAWAVNKVLAAAGVAPLDSNSVQSMESALTSGGRGTLVSPSAAMPGDIVIQAQDSHVGICLNAGCTQVISNASGNSTFSWISNTSFNSQVGGYNGGPGRIYQLNNP